MNLFSMETKERVQQIFPQKHFVFLESTTSTNDECKRICREKRLKNIVVIADAQTNGRGRYGRIWESIPQKNIYISFSFENVFHENIAALNLYLGVVVYEAMMNIHPELSSSLTIKWPNDIYLLDKKLAGILIENVSNNLDFLVIGLGVNIHTTETELPETGTSLLLGCENIDRKNSRERLITHLLTGIEKTDTSTWHSKFLKYSERTQKYFYNYTKQNKACRGILKELNENGSIVIENENAEKICIYN